MHSVCILDGGFDYGMAMMWIDREDARYLVDNWALVHDATRSRVHLVQHILLDRLIL